MEKILSNFKEYQDIVVLGMLCNGNRIDATGKYISLNIYGSNKGLHKVKINGIDLTLKKIG
jgi:hypothetical protein